MVFLSHSANNPSALSLTTQLPEPLNRLQTSPGAKTAEPGTSATWYPVPGPPWAGLTSQGRPCHWGWEGAEEKGAWRGGGREAAEGLSGAAALLGAH